MLAQHYPEREQRCEARRRHVLNSLDALVTASNALIRPYTSANLAIERDADDTPVRLILRTDDKEWLASIDYRFDALRARPAVLQVTGARLDTMDVQEAKLLPGLRWHRYSAA